MKLPGKQGWLKVLEEKFRGRKRRRRRRRRLPPPPTSGPRAHLGGTPLTRIGASRKQAELIMKWEGLVNATSVTFRVNPIQVYSHGTIYHYWTT